MHSLDLENINWDNPSTQNVVDLYYARMWAVSEAVADFLKNDRRPTKWFIDDIRTNFLNYTNLTRERFDALIEEGARTLELWGIPDVFVVYPEPGFGCEAGDGESVEAYIFTAEDMAEELADNTATENSLVLAVMQAEFATNRNETKLVEDTFFNIVKPGRKNANKG